MAQHKDRTFGGSSPVTPVLLQRLVVLTTEKAMSSVWPSRPLQVPQRIYSALRAGYARYAARHHAARIDAGLIRQLLILGGIEQNPGPAFRGGKPGQKRVHKQQKRINYAVSAPTSAVSPPSSSSSSCPTAPASTSSSPAIDIKPPKSPADKAQAAEAYARRLHDFASHKDREEKRTRKSGRRPGPKASSTLEKAVNEQIQDIHAQAQATDDLAAAADAARKTAEQRRIQDHFRTLHQNPQIGRAHV